MNSDDPKLTAYALNELNEPERSSVARAIADSPEALRFVTDTRKLARILKSEFSLDLEQELTTRKKPAAVPEEAFWSRTGPLAIAALIAVLAVISAVALSGHKSSSQRLAESALSPELAGARSAPHEFGTVEGEDAGLAGQNQSAQADAGPYAYTGERPFVSVMSKPRSSVPLFVNSASYLDVRRSINSGVLPSRDAVRVEGMINHFPYDYPQPGEDELFSLIADVVSCPWETSHRLVRIGVRGREAIALNKENRIEIEFNPGCVTAYRLIGYDREGIERRNPKEATEGSEQLPAGSTLTVLYEVIVPKSKQLPAGDGAAAPTEPLLSVKLQLTTPTKGTITSVERVVRDNASAFAAAPEDLKFAAAVAEFGMLLRNSEYKGNGTFENVLEWAVEGKGADREGNRADFIELVQKAHALAKG